MTEEENNFLEDFTILVPEKKIFKIGQKSNPTEIDISVFPARAMLLLMDIEDTHTKDQQKGNKTPLRSSEKIREMVRVVASACSVSNPKVTEEWLLSNMEFSQLSRFCMKVMEYGKNQMIDYQKSLGMDKKSKEGGGKNSQSGK